MTEPVTSGEVREALRGPPSGYFIVVPDPQASGAEELDTFVGELLTAWRLLLAMVVVGGLIALGVAFLMTPLYRAKALVAPVTSQGLGGQGGTLRQLSGLAALAGVDLGGGGGRKDESLATLSAKSFAREFIESNNLLPVLYAERWDARAGHWRAGATPPTLGQAVTRFTDSVVSISDDPKTSFVTVTVDWYSPQLAAQWANGLVNMVNEKLRQEAVASSQRSLEYLDKELAKTNVVEVRQAIYQLIERQVENATVANVQHDYAYHFLDPAIAPERKNSPKRALLGVAGAAIGLFAGVLVVFVRRAVGLRRAQRAARN